MYKIGQKVKVIGVIWKPADGGSDFNYENISGMIMGKQDQGRLSGTVYIPVQLYGYEYAPPTFDEDAEPYEPWHYVPVAALKLLSLKSKNLPEWW